MDIREFETLKKEVESCLLERAILREISQHLVVCEDRAELLNLLLDRLSLVADYRDAALARLTNDKFTILAYWGAGRQEDMIGQRLFTDPRHHQEILHHRKPVIVSDVKNDAGGLHTFQKLIVTDAARVFGQLGSLMAVPLIFRRQTLGCLLLNHAEPGWYAAQSAVPIFPFANYMALVLGNHQIYQ